MFNIAPGIGLDIGSKKIKLVTVRLWKKRVQIIDFGSIPTPPGVVEAGYILDPERLGEELGGLVATLKLKGKRVVSAVSGQQIYTRNLVMPRMKLKEMREAINFQATTFLPIPVEESAIDIFPLRNFEDDEGKKTEVFFVAVRQQQVDNLDTACRIAGLKLVAVEIEPLALFRLLGQNTNLGAQGFLNIGAVRSYFTVFHNGILIYYQSLAFGCSAFLRDNNYTNNENDSLGLDNIEIGQGNESYYLIKDIIAEVSRSVEYYHMQNEVGINKILLCGGGSRIKSLDVALATGIDQNVEIADTLADLDISNNINETEIQELKHDFSVALGLAVRKVI
ncbi:MAG: type IV pilus assembly protein PilM [Syntrophomonas sp.]